MLILANIININQMRMKFQNDHYDNQHDDKLKDQYNYEYDDQARQDARGDLWNVQQRLRDQGGACSLLFIPSWTLFICFFILFCIFVQAGPDREKHPVVFLPDGSKKV